jgi:type I restriction enzyme R subunit
MRLHPHNIAQKTAVMVEHFQGFSRRKIGGRAKAMVVTGSRLEAVRYKQSFDRYVKEKGYAIKIAGRLLRRSHGRQAEGSHLHGGGHEPQVVREKELPDVFATQAYQVLLVAEKYQTGFDQPLLHTMYVDKRLAGIQAVQTLSRLNRIHPLKEDTFVLDFVNDRDEIREAFKTYFEGAEVGEDVEPERMYEIKSAARRVRHLPSSTRWRRFSAVYFKPRQRQSPNDHQLMNAILTSAAGRFKELQEENPTRPSCGAAS